MGQNKFFRTVALNVVKSVGKKAIESEYLRKKYLGSHFVTKLGNDAYMITEAMLFNSYLFVGKDRALLIDTGLGIDGLLEEVKKITNKPLIVCATHSHFTSVGGAGNFDQVYIHKKDLKDASSYNKYRYRKLLYKALPTRYLLKLDEDALTEKKGRFVPFSKKQEFDLGGRNIRVIHTPSHTKGCCCFIDSVTDITVTGHVTAPFVFMLLPHAPTMAVYAKTFESLIEELKDRRNCAGVGLKPLSYDRTCDLKDLFDEAEVMGNDYTRIIRLRKSADKRRAILYFPAKTVRRNLWLRLRYR